MAVVNAFIIYKENTGSLISLLDFRRELGLDLLTNINVTVEMPFAAKRKKVSYSLTDSVRLGNVGVHFPLFNQQPREKSLNAFKLKFFWESMSSWATVPTTKWVSMV